MNSILIPAKDPYEFLKEEHKNGCLINTWIIIYENYKYIDITHNGKRLVLKYRPIENDYYISF